MNPYTSLWTGVSHGDGPRQFHLILLDNGRTNVLADEIGRQALRCIRCSACLNICPVYSRTGGHAYGSVYPGPIGAILTPQRVGIEAAGTLPYASSLCGACYDVCPVMIDIPKVLVELRRQVVEHGQESVKGAITPENVSMGLMAKTFAGRRRFESAQKVLQRGRALGHSPLTSAPLGPLAGWTASRDLPAIPKESFREWWKNRGS